MSLREGTRLCKDLAGQTDLLAPARSRQGDRESHNGLGIMYRDGLGVIVDLAKSLAHFQAAGGQDLAEAQINLAKIHIGTRALPLNSSTLSGVSS